MTGRNERPPSGRVVDGLLVLGLLVTAAGYVAAAVDPDAAGRALPWSLSAGPLSLAPLAVALAVATLAAVKLRWRAPVAALVALVLLAGTAVLSPMSFQRLVHPADVFGFVADWLQLAGEVTAAVAALVTTAHLVRVALRERRPRPSVVLSPADRWARTTVAAIRRSRATGAGSGST